MKRSLAFFAGAACVAIAASLSIALPSHASQAAANAAPSAATSATPSAPTTVVLSATPFFGAESAEGDGWMGVVVYVENVGASPAKGNVEITGSVAGGGRHGDDNIFVAKAPFNVPAGKRAAVRMPAHGLLGYMPSVVVRARAEDGRPLAEAPMASGASGQPLLVDVEPTPKLAAPLRGFPIPVTWSPRASTYYTPTPGAPPALLVGSPAFDRTTGDPVLPDRAAEYAPATVVLVRSDVLARLEGVALEALVNWVVAGGALAIVPSRPEDLRSGPLPELVGGEVTRVAAPAALLDYGPAVRPKTPPPGSPPEFDDPSEPPPPVPSGATPIAFHPSDGDDRSSPFLPIKGSTAHPAPPTRGGPLASVREKLTGFSGGNLQPSPYGASARYGLGEVHLLAFNPQEEPALTDPWAHGRLVDLLAKTWDRRASQVFPHGGGDPPLGNLTDVRRALDPNENFRIALGVSAILLIAYSILSGPVTFVRAMRKGKPLDPLLWAPLMSLFTFAAILLIGTAGKGWSGRARRVSLVETGAGMTRATIRRYRGFFSSQTRSLAIRATDRTAVLDVAAADSSDHGDATLRLDARGSVLENLTALPWQTVVVKEDAMTDLKGGVSVLPAADGSVDVVNHAGSDLADVLVWVPKQGLYWFARIKNGDTVHASSGKLLHTHAARSSSLVGAHTVHALDLYTIEKSIGGAPGEKLHKDWQPILSAAPNIDWEPDDAAAVMAQIVGGEGLRGDSGLALESDTLLLRVRGEGGAR